MNHLLTWLSEYRLLVSLLTAASILLLALTVLATPWLVARLPADYLLPAQSRKISGSLTRWLINVLRCIVGTALILLGIVMMITPGPGLVMLLLGISVTRFPGKQRLLVHVATRPSVFRSLNWMRQRHDKPPFDAPRTTLR